MKLININKLKKMGYNIKMKIDYYMNSNDYKMK